MSTCPSDETLQAIVEGRLTTKDPDILSHLDECPACRALVAEISAGWPALPTGIPLEMGMEMERVPATPSLRPAAEAAAPGMSVGRYLIVRELGRGAMGSVYEALHQDIERRAAIKVLLPELSGDPQLLNRMRNEARATNRVRHPGLVETYEFGRLPSGLTYIVMEYLDGESLRDRILRGGALPVSTALGLARQLASALRAAHAGGVIHRDLKPDNIMLISDPEQGERVKIIDFGLAKVAAAFAETQPRTRTGLVMGTPEYMAPEQCSGAGQVDGQADVYSLGVILFEMLSNQRPFTARTPLEVMLQQLRAPPPPLSRFISGLPDGLEALVQAMLDKDPARRPEMATLAECLRQLAPSLPPGAVTVAPSLLRAPPTAFIAGPPITEPRLFFGRRREVRRLLRLWRQPPLQNAAVIGPRRSGKTSLLNYLRALGPSVSLRPQQYADLQQPLPRFVFVDFQDPRLSTRAGLLRHLLAGLEIEPDGPINLDTFLCLLSEQLRAPTVILLDEIDLALSRCPELDDTFWEALRALATNQVRGCLGFVLASQVPPFVLAQSSQRGSPFFNIFGYTATLGPLSEEETREFLDSAPQPIPADAAAWICERSGRWPILLQVLCREWLLAQEEGEGEGEGEGEEEGQGESGAAWQREALRQIAPFLHLLHAA